MKKVSHFVSLLLFFLCMLAPATLWADPVIWFNGSQPVTYCVEGRKALVVDRAIDMFSGDLQLVTGQRPVASKDAVIRVVELDKATSSVIRRLRKQGIPVDELREKMDAFWLGVREGKIVVVGSNGRGTAYGILELSRMAGVSPWVWWGDVRPFTKSSLTIDDTFSTLQSPSVTYRGIFINDEDWSLRRWTSDQMGPHTYRCLFELLLRLRANVIWPAMHDVSPGFFTVKGNKEMADSFNILIGTSHCEPLLRNNVAEWNVKERGAYNYITNGEAVRKYWAERLQQVKGSEELFTIGMRGIHDGSMEGVKTREEKLNGLQQVIDDQRELIRKYYDQRVERVPQVFIPYKEVLEIYESGLRVPDDVTLMWCDDNYGYLTRLPDAEQQRRSGGGGVYYHLSYWGRPHDYLWLTTTQPGLLYSEMKAAYDHNCRRLWIANVHDPKVAAYDLELFLDMAWNINSITASPVLAGERGSQALTLEQHFERWLCTQFGAWVGKAIAPAMRAFYQLNAVRKPEFMGWTQVELDRKKYPGGKSVPSKTEFTLKEAYDRMEAFAKIEATVDVYAHLVREHLKDAYFAHVLYPVHAAAAMTRKMLLDGAESEKAYEEIQQLTEQYNSLNGGKWRGLLSAAPRNLPVFGKVSTQLPQHPSAGRLIARNACDYQSASPQSLESVGGGIIQMLGHSMNAVSVPKDAELTYEFTSDVEGEALLYTAMIPTQPSDQGDLRYSVQLDDQSPVTISLKEPYRSERWKQNVLRGQSLRATKVSMTKGSHTLKIKALDSHIIADQWMLDFCLDRQFYVIPVDR